MFQFPGFALKTLCIQVISTCFCPLMIRPSGPRTRPQVTKWSNNNEQSGGLPHSDIHGSKPIPGSPWLNAGYHVLHRLLLPRHPPNALFALDLIQEKQGLRPQSRSKAVLSHAPSLVHEQDALVSVLDLDNIARPVEPEIPPYAGRSGDTDVYLSKRCQIPSSQDDQTHPRWA